MIVLVLAFQIMLFRFGSFCQISVSVDRYISASAVISFSDQTTREQQGNLRIEIEVVASVGSGGGAESRKNGCCSIVRRLR